MDNQQLKNKEKQYDHPILFHIDYKQIDFVLFSEERLKITLDFILKLNNNQKIKT